MNINPGKCLYYSLWGVATLGCQYWFVVDGDATALNLFVWAPFMGLIILTFIIQTYVKLWVAFHPAEFLDEVRDWWHQNG